MTMTAHTRVRVCDLGASATDVQRGFLSLHPPVCTAISRLVYCMSKLSWQKRVKRGGGGFLGLSEDHQWLEVSEQEHWLGPRRKCRGGGGIA